VASAFLPFSLLLDVRRRFERDALLRDPALNVSTPFSLLPCEFRARFKGYLRFHLHWRCGAAKRPRTRTTTRTRTIGEAEDGNQDPRWRVPSASKRSINRVNIATTRVWLFLLASSASPIVLVLVVVSRPRPLCSALRTSGGEGFLRLAGSRRSASWKCSGRQRLANAGNGNGSKIPDVLRSLRGLTVQPNVTNALRRLAH
jgi:hypothetical protein